MPRNTKVHRMYEGMVEHGMSKERAAKIAQARTGKSLKTGKKPKAKRKAAPKRKAKR